MKVTVHDRGTTVVLGCGRVIEAFPQDDAGYVDTARELGYGDDTLQMCKDHDALHVLLCQWLGIEESFSLGQAIGMAVDPEVAAWEEAAVMAVQKLMMAAKGRMPT